MLALDCGSSRWMIGSAKPAVLPVPSAPRHHVAALHHDRNRLALDRRGRRVAHALHRGDDARVQAEMVEVVVVGHPLAAADRGETAV